MSTFTFSPALGWPAGIAIAVAMCALAAFIGAQWRRMKRDGADQTLGMCIRRIAACIVIALMALTPSIATATTSRAINATDVVIATDVTGSMAVKDGKYGSGANGISRLDAARLAIQDITSLYANSSFAAVSFGKAGTLDVPLTPDTQAIDSWASSLKAEPTSDSAGSSLDASLDTLLTTVKDIHDQHPDDRIILYLITDGEQTSPTTRRTFSSLRQYVNDSCVIGVGSADGGKIPVIDSAGTQSADQYVTDPSTGEPGISRMDADQIKSIADELSGSYLLLDEGKTLGESDIAAQSSKWRVTSTVKERTRTTPVVWPLAIVLAALLAWEAGAWLATSRRLL